MVLQPGSFRSTVEDTRPTLIKPTVLGMADHFVTSSKLGRYLTFQATGRFLISDEIGRAHV